MRKKRGYATTPALASESAATRSVAPCGIVTRTGVPLPEPHAMIVSATLIAARDRQPRFIGRLCPVEHLLKEYRRGERVDVAFATTRRAAHLAYGAKRRGRRIPLVH